MSCKVEGTRMTLSLISPKARLLIAAASVALLTYVVSKGVCDTLHPPHISDAQSQILTLWAWDTPENLKFLANEQTSVAYYAGTILVRADTVLFRPRKKPLEIPAHKTLCPVFRIENLAEGAVPESAIADIVQIVDAYTHIKDKVCQSVQVDYDATTSERTFYIRLLKALRRSLPDKTHISITALASWALDDRWMPTGIVDEAVVMLFSMGDSDKVLKAIGRKTLSVGEGMTTSIGISVNEPTTNCQLSRLNVIRAAHHLYIFDSHPWRIDRYLNAKRLIGSNP